VLEQFSVWTLVLIGGVLALGIFFHLFRYSSKTAEVAPAILTSIGIFGTFLGVALGLWHFDTADIQGSVPRLMDGLKTAFWTSIAGLFAALTLKIRAAVEQAGRRAASQHRAATIDDLDLSLQALVKQLHDGSEQSLRSELAKQHQSSQRRFDQLVDVLTNYQQKMADANAKALVEAIRAVMNEFNTKINEQYGENFRQLNESVVAMLEWQQTYRTQLDDLISEQERSSNLMKEASNSFEYMVRNANAFNGISESLQELLTGLETQRMNIHSQLGSLADMVNNAAEGLPKLEERLSVLTQGMSDAVQSQQRWATEELSQTQKELTSQLHSMMLESQEQLLAQQQQSQQHMQKLGERLERQVAQLDTGMEEELNKALRAFGLQLTALSEKFVSDYSPLTDKLTELVNMARQVED
jgi:ABC-type transporter Mla subunit MlaD